MKKFYRKNVEALHKINPGNNFIIDKQTRKDLALDDFYEKYNKTETSYGDQYFYHKINSQTRNKSDIDKIKSDLEYLSKNPSIADDLKTGLRKIGKQKRGDIIKDLWSGLTYTPRFLKYVPFWILFTPILLTTLFFIIGNNVFWGILLILTINLFLFKITNVLISSSAGSMNYLILTMLNLKKLSKNRSLDYFLKKIVINKNLNRIIKYKIFLQDGVGTSIVGNDLASSILDYLRVFLCAELYAYYKMYKYINRYNSDIKKIIDEVGYLDFILNNSNIIKNNETAYPEIVDESRIEFKGLYHPLVDNCKPYNIKKLNSMIITGMNMAGKSTFMKSVALNQILALSFGFVFSNEFKTSDFVVITSMKVEDDIKNNKSKYYMEAERLLLLQKMLKEKKVLCAIDEILTGTNTVDRIEASIGILKNFNKYSNSFILAATHDKDIAEKLYPNYLNYYFDGKLGDREINYDYKLKEGIVTRRNALELLHKIGLEVV